MTHTEINYTPSGLSHFDRTYDVGSPNSTGFNSDPVARMGVEDLAGLATSPDWEDRVRGAWLKNRLEVTLPDGFPCIYERVDSPNHLRNGVPNPHAKPFAWVVSPDITMLENVLDDYQLAWDSYTSQWGPSSRRLLAVGRLDGLSAYGVFRPGTTPEQVIAKTLITHDGMYRRVPERLQAMHPQHAQWMHDREAQQQRIAALKADLTQPRT
jgi:hypothetical protein